MFLKPQYLKNPFKLLKSAKKDYKCMKFLNKIINIVK